MILTTDEQLEALMDAVVHYLSETAVLDNVPKGMDYAGRRLRYVLDRIEVMRDGVEEIIVMEPDEIEYFMAQAGDVKTFCKQFLVGRQTVPRLEREVEEWKRKKSS